MPPRNPPLPFFGPAAALSAAAGGRLSASTRATAALSAGGRTLLTGAAASLLSPNTPDGQVLHRHGHYRFKGIDEPVEVADALPFSPAVSLSVKDSYAVFFESATLPIMAFAPEVSLYARF